MQVYLLSIELEQSLREGLDLFVVGLAGGLLDYGLELVFETCHELDAHQVPFRLHGVILIFLAFFGGLSLHSETRLILEILRLATFLVINNDVRFGDCNLGLVDDVFLEESGVAISDFHYDLVEDCNDGGLYFGQELLVWEDLGEEALGS